MVFRLGGQGSGTRFGLVRADQNLEREFFLRDEDCFQLGVSPTTFMSESGMNVFYPFQLLGSNQEGGAVNLAIASGLLAWALRLDDPQQVVVPCQRSFDVHFSSDSPCPPPGQVVAPKRTGRD